MFAIKHNPKKTETPEQEEVRFATIRNRNRARNKRAYKSRKYNRKND